MLKAQGIPQIAIASLSVKPVADRLTRPIDDAARVTLRGSVHPLARSENDRGAVADGMKLDRIQVMLKRSDAQEISMKRLIGDLHTPGSASYHKWLTPDEFGEKFGPSNSDVAKLSSWLGSHGFTVTKLNPGHQTLEFAGTAGQFRETFHAQIHSYQVNGETRFANANDPEIPEAIAPVFGGFVSLNNFRLKRLAKVKGTAMYDPATHEAKPNWTYGSSTDPVFFLAPKDFAVQYDLNPLYAANLTGAGQSIALIDIGNINVAQVNRYRALFGLPANPPQIIVDGNDPGVDTTNSPYGISVDSTEETYLDAELAGAVAPNAQIKVVVANDTAIEVGYYMAAEHAVYSNLAPVISASLGVCEQTVGPSNAFFNTLWAQAAAQGITVVVSAGDAGSAVCDNFNAQEFAVGGLAVNGYASTPYDIAVGGTDFYYRGGTADFSKYWNLTPTNGASTKSLNAPVPEQVWNDSQYGSNVYTVYTQSNDHTDIVAGGGGKSAVGLIHNDGSVGPYPKPSWQVGTGVPNDGVRDLPDVSLFAADGVNNSLYPICAQDGDCEPGSVVQITGVGGTSASAPAFAGMMALVNQKYGRQGQANYVLYPLAAQYPSVFHDVTVGTNSVPCNLDTVSDSYQNGAAVVSLDCEPVTQQISVTDPRYGFSTEGQIALAANTPLYNAAPGYDLATGLGTIDANNMVTNWTNIKFAATGTTLGYTTASTPITHGSGVTISGKVTAAVAGGAIPTGTVALLATSTDTNDQAITYFTLDSSGAYTGTVNYLPGGTYNISGVYSGDGLNAPSTSPAIPITIGSEASVTNLQVYSGTTFAFAPIASGSTVTYGTPLILSAQPSAKSGTVSNPPTGTVLFSDGSTALGTTLVDVEGDAEYNGALSAGSHSVTAAYSGDGSYTPSVSAPAYTISIAKNTPAINIVNIYQNSSGTNILTPTGAFLTVQVENTVSFTNLPILAPSGTLTLTGAPAGTTASATLTPGIDPNTGRPAGIAVFQVPANVDTTKQYAFNFQYAGDANYAAASATQTEAFAAPAGGTPATITATASAAAASPAAQVIVTATVTGANGVAPTGNVVLVSSGNNRYIIGNPGLLTTTTGATAAATIVLDSATLYQGTNRIIVLYEGNSTYNAAETTITLANPLSDFTLFPAAAIVNVPSNGLATNAITLNSSLGFSGAVMLTCTASGGVNCSLNPASVNVVNAGQTTVTLNLNTAAVTAAGTYSVLVTGSDSTGQYVHTIGLQVATPIITMPAGFTLGNSAAITIASQGGSGTSTVSVTSTNGFTGAVALACSVTSSPGGSTEAPTCSVSPSSVNVTGTAAVASTLTINTTAQTVGRLDNPPYPIISIGGGTTLVALLLFGLPMGTSRQRANRAMNVLRIFCAALFFVLVAGVLTGCGHHSSPTTGGGLTGGTTTGAYTVTVTGTSGTITATTTVAIMVQ